MASDYEEQRDELLESIERDQEELLSAVQDLTGAARESLDPSGPIREYPWAWLIGGFVFGLWLGGRRRSVPIIVTEGERR